jgi:DNA-binding CsgD family transcriptional regulator
MKASNLGQFLNIFERNSDSCIVYSFGLPKEFNDPIKFYLNHLPLVEKFIKYFNAEAKGIIDLQDSKKRAHYTHSFEFHEKSPERLLDEKAQQFLQTIIERRRSMESRHGEMIKLTRREIDCLHYLTLGYGIKGVAAILDISARTVETHINKAKYKTCFYTKQELLTNFIDLFRFSEREKNKKLPPSP